MMVVKTKFRITTPVKPTRLKYPMSDENSGISEMQKMVGVMLQSDLIRWECWLLPGHSAQVHSHVEHQDGCVHQLCNPVLLCIAVLLCINCALLCCCVCCASKIHSPFISSCIYRAWSSVDVPHPFTLIECELQIAPLC